MRAAVVKVPKQRSGTARWNGDLQNGSGTVNTETGTLDARYDAPSRFEEGDTTNPEELIGAAHAACYSMALANLLSENGHEPESIETTAHVSLDTEGGPAITGVRLETRGTVSGIDENTFRKFADDAKEGCPVSGALGAIEITLDASLER